MSFHNNGGPAFPTLAGREGLGGMTLRDYFAAKVLGALAAESIKETVGTGRPQSATVADLAYVYADAMLAQRDKP